MNACFLTIPLGAAVVVAALHVAGTTLSLPVVSYDTETGECVRVESPRDEFSCGYMPDRYIHQWVYQPVTYPISDPELAAVGARP